MWFYQYSGRYHSISPRKFWHLHLSSFTTTIIFDYLNQYSFLTCYHWQLFCEIALPKKKNNETFFGTRPWCSLFWWSHNGNVFLKKFARKNSYSENFQDKTIYRESSFWVTQPKTLRFLLIRFPLFWLYLFATQCGWIYILLHNWSAAWE